MKLDDIQAAQTDTTYHVSFPLQVKNGDGTFHEKAVEIDYRPITEELMVGSPAMQLSKVIIGWNVEDEPTYDNLKQRPVPFLRHIIEVINGDYLPKKVS